MLQSKNVVFTKITQNTAMLKLCFLIFAVFFHHFGWAVQKCTMCSGIVVYKQFSSYPSDAVKVKQVDKLPGIFQRPDPPRQKGRWQAGLFGSAGAGGVQRGSRSLSSW